MRKNFFKNLFTNGGKLCIIKTVIRIILVFERGDAMQQARKHSRKRDAILECVRGTTCHPSADWIYAQLKPQIPDLSLGTVYRNLAMFREEGTVESVGTVDGLERFDGRVDPHGHFVCTACGAVIDVDRPELPDTFLNEAAAASGCEIRTYRLNYYGLCPECRKKSQA